MVRLNFKKVSQNLYEKGLIFFAVSPLLPFNYRNGYLFILLIAAVVVFFKVKSVNSNNLKRILYINSSFFLVMFISAVFSQNYEYGIEKITRMLSLIIMPLSLYILNSRSVNLNKKKYNSIITIYFFSNIIFYVIVFSLSYLQHENFLFHTPEFINSKIGKYSIHPLYASINLTICLILSLKILNRFKATFLKFLVAVSSVFAIIFLFFLSRKLTIILTPILLLIHFRCGYNKPMKLTSLFILIFFIIGSMYFAPIKNRYADFFNFKNVYLTENKGSIAQRINLYNCSLSLIKQKPIIGFGFGDVEKSIQTCNFKSLTNNVNSHNQFFSAWLSSGILGVSSLILIFYFHVSNAIKMKNTQYLLISTSFIFVMVVENYLERQDGVLTFSFFMNIYPFLNSSLTSKD